MNNKLFIYITLFFVSSFSVWGLIGSLSANSPPGEYYTNDTTPEFSFTVLGNSTTYNCTLYIGGLEYGTNDLVYDGSANIVSNGTLSGGNYSWYVNCTDAEGTSSTGSRNIIIDLTAPIISIGHPIDEQYYNMLIIDFNFTVSGEESCWYNLDGDLTELPACANTLLNITDGSHSLTVYANDTANNTASYTVTFIVDTTVPGLVDVLSPVPSVGYNVSVGDSFFVDVLFSENLSFANISFDGGAWDEMGVSGGLDSWSINRSGLFVGLHNYTITFWDLAFNSNTSLSYDFNVVDVVVVPDVVLLYPSNDTFSNVVLGNFSFNFTVSDGNSSSFSCGLYFDDLLNQSNDSVVSGVDTVFVVFYVSEAVHFWYVNCTNGDNYDVSELRTLTIAAQVDDDNDGGGGSSRSRGSSSSSTPYVPPTSANTTTNPSVKYSYALLEKGTRIINLTNNQIPLYSLSLMTIADISNASLKITLIENPPVAKVEMVYKYFQIDHETIQDAVISSIKLQFKVSKSWLANNKIEKNQVVLYRYTNNWNTLNTSVIKEDKDDVYYESISAGLSVFAIATKPRPPVTVIDPITGESQINSSSTDVNDTENDNNNSNPIIVSIIVIALIVILLYSFYTKKKKKNAHAN
jgi:PGF-pre-PGF domain-containing protein